MLYKFSSGATGNLIMTGPVGDRLLAAIGKPVTPKGIVAAAALPAAIRALEQVVAVPQAADPAPDEDEVTLRQRAWPLLEMFRQAEREQVAVVWGV